MKRSEKIKKRMEQIEAQIDAAFKQFVESADEAQMNKYKNLTEAYHQLEGDLETALDEETLDERQDPANNENPETFTEAQRQQQMFNLTEAEVTFVQQLREAVAVGARWSGTIPATVADKIQRRKSEIAVLRKYCTVHKAGGDYTVYVAGDGVTVDYVAPNAQINTQKPGINALKLSALKIGGLALVANELIKDLTVDIIAYLVEEFAEALAKWEDKEILTGKGTGDAPSTMHGITTVGNHVTEVTSSSATGFTWEDVKKCLAALGAYRNGATMVMTPAAEEQFLAFKDGSKYMFDQSKTLAEQHPRGCNVVITDQLPAELTTGNIPLVIGDFSRYHLLDRNSMEVMVLNERYADFDQTGVRVLERIDGNFVPEAFVTMKIGA